MKAFIFAGVVLQTGPGVSAVILEKKKASPRAKAIKQAVSMLGPLLSLDGVVDEKHCDRIVVEVCRDAAKRGAKDGKLADVFKKRYDSEGDEVKQGLRLICKKFKADCKSTKENTEIDVKSVGSATGGSLPTNFCGTTEKGLTWGRAYKFIGDACIITEDSSAAPTSPVNGAKPSTPGTAGAIGTSSGATSSAGATDSGVNDPASITKDKEDNSCSSN